MPGAAITTIELLGVSLPPVARLLGLDLGTTTIGIAVSDVTRRIATPLETLSRTRFRADADRLLAIVKREAAAALIVGLPINMDGSEGPRAQSTRAFVRNLVPLCDVPITFWDERLSTAAVERMLIEADRSRTRREEVIDKLAAAYILQGALDRLANLSSAGPS